MIVWRLTFFFFFLSGAVDVMPVAVGASIPPAALLGGGAAPRAPPLRPFGLLICVVTALKKWLASPSSAKLSPATWVSVLNVWNHGRGFA